MAIFGFWQAFGRDRRGGISILMAFALPAFIGTLALGTEISLWLLKNRSLQNAADSAVVAASLDGSSGYLAQAKAVTARYGLVDGVGGVSVTGSNAATCATGEINCYSVTVAATMPIYLGAIVGYLGNAGNSTKLSAIAYARRGSTSHDYCLVALASNGTTPGVYADNASGGNLAQCGVASNTAATCTGGYDLGADYGDAVTANTGCGGIRTAPSKAYAEPYAAYAWQLPGDYCNGNYPQNTGTLPNSNKWSGTMSLGSYTLICGDILLTGNVTIVAPADALVLLYNGELATNGFRLQTASGSALALIFSGTNNALYTHTPTGSGRIDITAPTKGPAAGVAIYTDPALTIGVHMPSAGTAPGLSMTGLVYMPHADLVFTGAVGAATYGKRCTVIVANSVKLTGPTRFVLSTAECDLAGLTVVPTSTVAARGTLAG
jgi:hypothetical protein